MLKNYQNCLDAFVCPDSSSPCHLGEMENCSGTANMKDNMTKVFDKHRINEVRFPIWLQTDRCTMKTLVMDADKFLNDFCERLLK